MQSIALVSSRHCELTLRRPTACTNLKQILVAVQNLLDCPNNDDAAQRPVRHSYLGAL